MSTTPLVNIQLQQEIPDFFANIENHPNFLRVNTERTMGATQSNQDNKAEEVINTYSSGTHLFEVHMPTLGSAGIIIAVLIVVACAFRYKFWKAFTGCCKKSQTPRTGDAERGQNPPPTAVQPMMPVMPVYSNMPFMAMSALGNNEPMSTALAPAASLKPTAPPPLPRRPARIEEVPMYKLHM